MNLRYRSSFSAQPVLVSPAGVVGYFNENMSSDVDWIIANGNSVKIIGIENPSCLIYDTTVPAFKYVSQKFQFQVRFYLSGSLVPVTNNNQTSFRILSDVYIANSLNVTADTISLRNDFSSIFVEDLPAAVVSAFVTPIFLLTFDIIIEQ